MIVPVVMAGGSGTRLWPLSRKLYPKQFLSLLGEKTMLELTLERVRSITQLPPILICNEEHRFLAAEQVRRVGVDDASIILEPCGRNTAPAIALAALRAVSNGEDPLLLVVAADHFIEKPEAFVQAVGTAINAAKKGDLVTFGVVPSKPETGYGYIQKSHQTGQGIWKIARFCEKPDIKDAREYVASGEYFWNSGIFFFRASAYLEALKTYAPDILEYCQAAFALATNDLDFIRIDKDAFANCPENSIDYAVMEHTERGAMVPLDAGWTDIGSWASLWEVMAQDNKGNGSQGDVFLLDTVNSLVYANNRLVVALGVENLILVETKDAVLVADKAKVQDVKEAVRLLDDEGRQEHILHREVYRPWGKYDAIDEGNRYQVKRITVQPGAALSLQLHHHRAEHWIVVSGTAEVRLGDQITFLTENESTYIPVGQIHSLKNPGKVPLELIEVQSGTYLGEDDIVRFDDQYGRL
ncbi:mannose-1-phosphate guanylyltransferase/mannose-6-phosphate isomerase [Neptuniibacter sp. CAU 1671]|uniref:mannose-1-phosphate guanylyltransferase/mannose-6-phosphate isomerase n=1 Tax=Neptuniibacter sp. CAU 1671 TaxID=3032593 RepID=UPI0023DA77F0|nr:mannose-1-phosphate guanylyltransferase/mannose-6-phosphate isomerase [Neptuniibacter sp. CAU 1671]MDF2181394.1 mannose-1-phosphate guanylyltransferase/mannose-6-phosphate isomerase [Neptuniibacter sp. CAU 1671]